MGDLKPHESVILSAWTINKANEYDAKKIRVTHDFGLASMDVRGKVGRLGRWIDRHQFGLGAGIWLVSIVICGVFWSCGNLKEKKFKEKRGETTDAEKKEET